MSIQTHFVTQSLSQWENNFALFDLDKRKADQMSLCMSATSSRTIASQMSKAGLRLLDERNNRLKGVTDPDQRQQIYFETRLKAEAIAYSQPDV